MRYCLDANVYIQAYQRYYAFDIVPGFWDALIDWAENEHICSPISVYDELVPSNPPYDDLSQWAKDNKNIIFLDVDEEIVDAYTNIADFAVAHYEPQHVQLFLNGADPWVIAFANAKELTVVTMESRKNEVQNPNSGFVSGKIKIPNVCENFGVDCFNTFGFLRDLGKSFH